MSDYIMIALLTLAVYYPLTLGALLFVLFAKAAYDWHRYS